MFTDLNRLSGDAEQTETDDDTTRDTTAIDATVSDNLALPLPQADDSEVQQLASGIDGDLAALSLGLRDAIDSYQLPHATGGDLDEIGKDFGRLGRRRGRDDRAYRQFLSSIVRAFEGRGTVRDVKFAVGLGIGRGRDDVRIDETFIARQNTQRRLSRQELGVLSGEEIVLSAIGGREYQLTLTDWEAHQSDTVRTLAELSDAVSVSLVEPVRLLADSASVTPSAFLQLQDASARTVVADGLSSETLEPLSTDGFALSV